MPESVTAARHRTPSPVGALLREWRAARRMSQLDLSLAADMSTRHLSYVETGKAQPGRETLFRLADALAMPLRERNSLLLAAGYAPQYPENPLATSALERMRQAIELIVAHQEPYPAFVVNRHFDVLMANPAVQRVNDLVMRGRQSAHSNLLRQVFDPDDIRQAIVNWSEVAQRFSASPAQRHRRRSIGQSGPGVARRSVGLPGRSGELARPRRSVRTGAGRVSRLPQRSWRATLLRDHHDLRSTARRDIG